jgi:hypothetical protein
MDMEFNHADYVIVFVSNLMLLFTYFVDQRKFGVCKLVLYNREGTRR